MRGTVILSEQRSGTNWLGGLANSTGLLGHSNEWLLPNINKLSYEDISADEFIGEILRMSSTPNGYFMMKVFPYQQYRFHRAYGIDVLRRLREENDVLFLRLERRDRIGQAISYAKAIQSKEWTHGLGEPDKQKYDFGLICRCYFAIGRNNEYWKSYCELHSIDADLFYYEDLLPDGQAFLDRVASHASVKELPKAEAQHAIQRNKSSDEWRTRFEEDLRTSNTIPHATPTRPPYRRLFNVLQVLRGKHTKPYPFSY